MMKKRQFITAEDGKQLKKKIRNCNSYEHPPPFDYIFIDKLFKKFG